MVRMMSHSGRRGYAVGLVFGSVEARDDDRYRSVSISIGWETVVLVSVEGKWKRLRTRRADKHSTSHLKQVPID